MSFFGLGGGILGSALASVAGGALDSFLSSDEVNTQPIPSFYFEVILYDNTANKYKKAEITQPGEAASGFGAIAGNMLSAAKGLVTGPNTLNPGDYDKEWYLKAFIEVSGIEVGVEIDTKQEGGNNYPISLPSKMKNQNLTLKRLVRLKSMDDVWDKWIDDTIKAMAYWNKPIETRIIQVNIMHPNLNADGNPYILASIDLFDAYPVKATYGTLNSTSEDLLTQEIEIAYSNVYGKSGTTT